MSAYRFVAIAINPIIWNKFEHGNHLTLKWIFWHRKPPIHPVREPFTIHKNHMLHHHHHLQQQQRQRQHWQRFCKIAYAHILSHTLWHEKKKRMLLTNRIRNSCQELETFPNYTFPVLNLSMRMCCCLYVVVFIFLSTLLLMRYWVTSVALKKHHCLWPFKCAKKCLAVCRSQGSTKQLHYCSEKLLWNFWQESVFRWTKMMQSDVCTTFCKCTIIATPIWYLRFHWYNRKWCVSINWKFW